MDRFLMGVQCYECITLVEVDKEGYFICPKCGLEWKE